MDGGFGDYGRTKLPKWRDCSFSINPADLLGRTRCARTLVEPEHAVLISMPEGDYAALLKVERMTWTRKLWPWRPLKRERTYRDITVPDCIPFSGKGENSWDCGEDGLCATGFDVEQARTDEAACALYAASVLETRRKRHDPRVWPESPGDRAARIATMRASQVAESSSSKEEPQ